MIYPQIYFPSLSRDVSIEHHTLYRYSDDVLISTRTQIPISYNYAFTVYKSQGLTINNHVYFYVNDIFAAHELYVGLSRVKSIENVTILISEDNQQNFNNLIIINENTQIYNEQILAEAFKSQQTIFSTPQWCEIDEDIPNQTMNETWDKIWEDITNLKIPNIEKSNEFDDEFPTDIENAIWVKLVRYNTQYKTLY